MGEPHDTWVDVKNRDPFIFKTAEDFFGELESSPTTKRPTSVDYNANDQKIGHQLHPACSHGAILRFNDGALLLVQFIRPRVWRVRFHSTNKTPGDFTDYNTRTIIQDTLSNTIQVLDIYENVKWSVEVELSDPRYIIIQSIVEKDGARQVVVQLWVQRSPFKITAVRPLKPMQTASLPSTTVPAIPALMGLDLPAENVGKVIWQTAENPLQYNEYGTALKVQKSDTAKFCGFGEQGGKRFFKEGTYMNYFSFDNMRYFNVYDKGPEWDAEPLYHSDPYWIEVNGLPGYQSQVSTFVDNYSQICVDLTKGDPSAIRIATRFNSFQCLFFAGDTMQDLINSLTSVIGRPRLKPRYILGNHQGCYGYNTKGKVIESADKYWDYDFPLDGMHVDVDIQNNYRTFSIDFDKFPKPGEMFSYLRHERGVKCSTNITPFICSDPSPWYTTLNEGLEKGYFVMDNRDVDPSAPAEWQVRYQQFGKGNRYYKNPSNLADRPGYTIPDNYKFYEKYNKNVPYHGGLSYGDPKGRPGHYPNLNNEEVRKWWGLQYKNLFDAGLEFVWQDMTSPCMSHSYGDMKSWPFRLLLDSDGWSGDPKTENQKKKAIEIWSLYSYNLHKATYHGLNNMPMRAGKRNFIIGRGSFTGAHRYAGLWTGDNSSTWKFFDISVAQVLSLGLSGVTIAGADVGGFEPPMAEEGGGISWCDPELLVRWYGAYSLLPWFRNHYTKYGGKHFQEPWAYKEFIEGPGRSQIPSSDISLYEAVYPACRWIIRLRYSLLQLLYDAMFENMLNGLPLARAMIITDTADTSLFDANQWYTRSQYLVRNDLMVAPVLYQKNPLRKLYLPYPNSWYPMNIRPYDQTSIEHFGEKLGEAVHGGSYVKFDATISAKEEQLPYVTPMYIREGGIIPQIEVRKFVADRTDEMQAKLPANPLTIHVYPGRDNSYDMYLDDGVSRESAPSSVFLAQRNHNFSATEDQKNFIAKSFGDNEASNKFTQYRFSQETVQIDAEGTSGVYERHVRITCPWKGYSWDKIVRDIGDRFRLIFWHEPNATDIQAATFTGTGKGWATFDSSRKATVVWLPVQQDGEKGITVSVKHS